jgi:hypothetical protein
MPLAGAGAGGVECQQLVLTTQFDHMGGTSLDMDQDLRRGAANTELPPLDRGGLDAGGGADCSEGIAQHDHTSRLYRALRPD